jgi:hypothetical protein
MKYPEAIVIAATILGGAVILAHQGQAGLMSGTVALFGPDNASAVWVARASGDARFCRMEDPTIPRIVCSDWK